MSFTADEGMDFAALAVPRDLDAMSQWMTDHCADLEGTMAFLTAIPTVIDSAAHVISERTGRPFALSVGGRATSPATLDAVTLCQVATAKGAEATAAAAERLVTQQMKSKTPDYLVEVMAELAGILSTVLGELIASRGEARA